MKYRWLVAVLCFLLIFLGLGFCISGRSIFLAPITQALNISRSAFSACDSIRYATAAVLSFLMGKLIQHFGTKRLICIGLIALLAATLLYATASHLLLFYVGSVFFGIGLALGATAMVSTVINSYFPGKSGTLMGVILGANGLGAAVSVQIFTPLIESHPFGYRTAFFITFGIIAVLLILFLILYKDPQQIHKKQQQSGNDGLALTQLRHMPVFYVTVICVLLTSAILQGVSGIAAAHVRDVGLSAQIAATMVSVSSVALLFSKILSGFVTDKLGLRTSVNLSYMTTFCAILLLIFLTEQYAAFTYGYAVMMAMGLPLETVMLPLLTTHLFGRKDFAAIMGIMSAIHSIGSAIGTPLINLSYDQLGTYRPVLTAVAALPVILLICYQWIIPHIKNIRKREVQ